MKYLFTFLVLMGLVESLCSKDYETIRLYLPTPCQELSVDQPALKIDDWVTIIPNPNDGMFQLEFAEMISEQPADLVIYNIQGGIVHLESIPLKTNIHSVDLSALSAGVYFIILRTDLALTPKKLILY